MRKVYDAVVTTGEYTDRDGNKKKRYLTLGAVLEGDNGLSLKLEAVPVNFNGWINFYEPKGDRHAKKEQPPSDFKDDQDIPF